MTNMTPKQILIEARELISDPKRWAQGAPARNARGISVSVVDEKAQSFCSFGAIYRSANMEDWTETLYKAHGFLQDEMCGKILDYNDTHTHEEVLAAFDRAIASCDESENV